MNMDSFSVPATLHDPVSRILAESGFLSPLMDFPDRKLRKSADFPVDIKEHGDSYRILADLPGFSKDEIEADLEDSVLTITARRQSDGRSGGEEKHVRRERTAQSLARSFRLPKNIDGAGISAKLVNGVLVLTLPKSSESAKREIEIEVQ